MAGHNSKGKSTSLDQIWDDLKEGIQQIYLKQNMEKAKYIQLYTYPFKSNSVGAESLLK